MRKVVLVAYYENESALITQNGVSYDKYGLTKIVEQVLTDFNFASKIDIRPKEITLYGLFNAPTAGGNQMTAAERDYLSVFKLPLLAFYDSDTNRFYGILEQKDFKYNAIKSCLDVIANTKSFDATKGYEALIGNTTYFYRDARNAHLNTGGTDTNPKHSLLDAVYLGANLGVFDRPYLRDAWTNFIDGLKKYWWLIPLGIGGVVVYKNSQQKRRNTRYVKVIKGISRHKKKKRTPSVNIRKKVK